MEYISRGESSFLWDIWLGSSGDERDFGLTVEHTDFIQTPGATPECDEDHYLLTINCRQIEVILVRDYGLAGKGI
jgi:hypothetical protein